MEEGAAPSLHSLRPAIIQVEALSLSIMRRKRSQVGSVYLPLTNSNIGRISVFADPQMATLGLVEGLKLGQQLPAELDEPGCVGWHVLLAADRQKAFAFYGELFVWQNADAETDPTDTYQLFSAGGQTIGGMFTKR